MNAPLPTATAQAAAAPADHKGSVRERVFQDLRRVALPDGSGPVAQAYYFYGHYYAAQAMYLAGGDWWRDWWPRIRSELIQHQEDDGSWSDPQWGQPLGTSMALIIMQMPKRYLPIFQK